MSNQLTPTDDQLMTIGELRKITNDPSLWVLNTSDRQGTRKQGDILLDVPSPGGRSIIISVPKTWIPVDLSTYARRDMILESTDFLNAVRNMAITPVSTEWAESIEKRADVRDERNYLALRSSGGEFNPATTNRAGAANQGLQPLAAGDVLDGVSPRVISVMEAEDPSMTPAVKLLSLKNLQAEIKGPELRYILSKCTPETENISKWVNEAAKAIQAAGGTV